MNPFRPRQNQAQRFIIHQQQLEQRLQEQVQLEQEQLEELQQRQEQQLQTMRAAHFNQNHGIDAFIQNFNEHVQLHNAHLDVGGGDGLFVWSGRLPPAMGAQNGSGDTREQMLLGHLMMPTL
ncbi:splicing factor 3B subunit 4-like [Scaptodrosophila lebanonensis]|uniref:Splicing factor 3B subunit 4-like n=1 Tax=Drosophila lebanonensis TaxID=7225 RepID=A0A6J2U314_DROLE|nr:splicing factor 3B subunit 4-like [Scaptodrosophila lebanonensis]XP_030381863.1 splicing factor 3B subunit 4-like [Scaptodrosophila lebanonensis]